MARPQSLGGLPHTDSATGGPVRRRAVENFCRAAMAATATIAAISMAVSALAAQPVAKPNPAAVERAVERFFQSQPDYQPGDLITSFQIQQLLSRLDDEGAPVPGAEIIADRGLPADSFLAKQLFTPAGKKFMRKLAATPGAFARLERLSAIPRGEQLIRDLMRDPGGDKLIEYLATTNGGRNMGNMMAGVPGGADFNRPTGRIYNAADLATAINAACASEAP